MPINAHPDYIAAEGEYLKAQTKEQKIRALKKMISHAPAHKGAENLRAQLKKRLARLKYTKEKQNKQKRGGGKAGIKKEEMQAVIIGMTNSGKSSLLSSLTKAEPDVANYEFTTKQPIVGMMNYQGVQIQLIEIPAFESEYYDKGLVNSTDTLIIIVKNLDEIKNILNRIKTQSTKTIIIFNRTNQDENELRKISATLQSKKYNFVMINLETSASGAIGLSARDSAEENLNGLKEKIFQSFDKIRVYTKEPGKEPKKEKPVILEKYSTVKNVAERILHGFSNQVKETKIWGPSSKFPGQIVGLSHKLKDLDVVEFKTK